MEERIYPRGQRIGNYEVLDLIARGGFSAVYNVKDLEDHGEEEARPEECALKIGRFDLSSLPEEQRFALGRRLQQEFDLVANLIHLNVVRVFESQWHQGVAFYTMERLKGPTLAGYLSEKQRPLEELCDGQPRAPRELNPDAPPALSALALECLAKDGKARPGDGAALRARLTEALRSDASLLQRLAPRAQVGSDTSGGPRPLPDEEATPAAPGTESQLQERQRVRVQRKLRSVQAMQVGLAAGVVLTIGAFALAGVLALKLGGLMEQTAAVARDAATAKVDASRQLAAAHEMLANTQRQLAEQLIQGSRLPVFSAVALAGLKMPEKPDPTWLRPTPDGRCVDPASGQQLHGCAALRGACWSVTAKVNPAKPCPFDAYDAPPEAPPHLKNRCFDPLRDPRIPQAATPGTK